jgi:prepilin-type N-terminal cleavage/methylation domain-containing protein
MSRQGGFSMLELTVVVCLVAILVTIAIDRLMTLRVAAERVAMAQVVGNIQSAMGIELARRVVRGGLDAAKELEGSNPMALLAKTPENYLGEMAAPDYAALRAGNWVFDSVSGNLVYIVKNSDDFRTTLPGPAQARFRFKLVYTDKNGNGQFDQQVDDIGGFRLHSLAPYQWQNRPPIGVDYANRQN